MATNITGTVMGGTPKAGLNADTVHEVYELMGLSGNYTASVNGEPADMNQELDDYNHVSFSQSIKGGNV